MDFTPVFTFLQGLAPWVHVVLQVLGAIVVIGTFIDGLTSDKGAMAAKILGLPLIGQILSQLTKFSPFNVAPTDPTPPTPPAA